MKLYDNLRSVLIPSGYKLGQIYPQKQLVMNDPAYWFNNATAGNYVSTPNAAANQITGDIDIITYATNYLTSVRMSFISKYSGATLSYLFCQENNSRLGFYFNAATFIQSSVINPLIGIEGWVRVTRNSSNGIVKFFTSTDNVRTALNNISWIQLGTDVSSTPGLIQNSGVNVEIGSWQNGAQYITNGRIYRATISNVIGGTPVVDFNPNDFNWNASMLQNSQTFTSRTTGEVWTIHSTGQGYIMPYLETIPLTRESAGSRSLPSGVIESMAANMPRLDSPLNGCPGILMEPPRTNLLLSSNTRASNWTFNATNISRSISTEQLNPEASFSEILTLNNSGTRNISQTITKAASSLQYTISAIVKKNVGDFVELQGDDGLNVAGSWFNLEAKTVGSQRITGTGFTLQSANIKEIGFGFLHISITITTNTAITLSTNIFLCNGNNSLVGNAGQSIFLWNVQTELGFYSSSPIITAGSTITRLADTITPASYHFIGLGNKGTIVVDYTLLGLHSAIGGTPFMLVDNLNTANSKMYLLGEAAIGMRIWDYANGIYYYNATQTVGTRYKVLFKWDNTYGCCYVNGVKILEKFDSVTPYYFNYIRNLAMTTNSIRLNELLTDNIAVSHLDCIKLTT
jgi:hypothetical protein